MELSLWGAFILLVLVNPVVFVATYDWWPCFFGVCAYFAVAFLIYEVILSCLLRVVPYSIYSLSQARLDARLPLRVGLCILMRCYPLWFAAGAALVDHSYLPALLLKRFCSRSTLPLLALGCLGKGVSDGHVLNCSIALFAVALTVSGIHLSRRRCNLDVPHLRFLAGFSVDICALVSATLVYTLAFQNFRSSIAMLCAFVEFAQPLLGKSAQAPMKRPAGPRAPIEYLSMVQLLDHEADIRDWLCTEPTLGKKRLCRLMLEKKGLHVKPKTAENYLIRLRREEEAIPRTMDIRGPIALWSTLSPQTRLSWRLSDLYTPRSLLPGPYPGRVSPHESDDELLEAISTYETTIATTTAI